MTPLATFPHGPFPFLHHPSRWNYLPEHIRRIDKLTTFKRQLKSHLFQSAFDSASDAFLQLLTFIDVVYMYVIVRMHEQERDQWSRALNWTPQYTVHSDTR